MTQDAAMHPNPMHSDPMAPDSMDPAAMPHLVLDVGAIEHNVALKKAWAAGHGMVLAPHIKTTMTREIVTRQLPGAWGVTVATVPQARLAVEWGARRVLIANEVLFAPHLAALRALLDTDGDLEVFVLADSDAAVDALAAAFAGAWRPLGVLVDIGTPGGRTGLRCASDAEPIARRILAKAGASGGGLEFAGVSAYEGVAPNLRTPENLDAIDAHCARAQAAFDAVRHLVRRDSPEPAPIFSVGGSAFQDRAAEFLPPRAPQADEAYTAVLRSGCYVVHDHGTYASVSPVPGLRAAARVRALVISTPEPGLAVLNAGKRELAYDAGLPVLLGPDGSPDPSRGRVDRLFDHHAVVLEAGGPEEGGLAVGDVVELGISHPCSVFDRWRDALAVFPDGTTEVWHPQL